MKMKSISSAELKTLYEKDKNINILDVREESEYEMGHIPGAEFKPLSEFPIQIDNEKTYYVICAGGGRSSMACEFLQKEGYDVVNVNDGMSAWSGDIE